MQLLTREDRDIAEEVAKILRQDGVEIVLNAKATKVEQAGEKIRLQIESSGKSTTLEGSHLLVATGRAPNCDTLNLTQRELKPTIMDSSSERSVGNDSRGHLCAGRHQGRSGIHTYFVRRFSNSSRESARRKVGVH